MSNVTPFDLASVLAVLQAARRPSGQSHTAEANPGDRPTSLTVGADVSDALVAWLGIDLREDVAFRTARLSIPTLNAGSETFSVTISGTTVTEVTASTDVSVILNALATTINANPTLSGIVTAAAVIAETDEASASAADQLRIRGLASNTNEDYSLSFTVSGGSSVVAAVADAASARATVYGYRNFAVNSTANRKWRQFPGLLELSHDGYAATWNVGPTARLYVRLFGLDGPAADGSGVTYRTPDIDVAPAILES